MARFDTMRQRILKTAAIIILTVLFGVLTPPAALAPAQQSATSSQSAQAGGFVMHIQRNEVLVDVRVTDKKGNPITGLKQSDFRIYEDGVPQQINSFDFENIEKLATATGESGAPQVVNLAKLPKTTSQQELRKLTQNHRMIVLFFDLTSMQIDDLTRALKSATQFIKTQTTPADLVAVVTYTSDLRVLQGFTNDRDALNKAIKGIQVGVSSSLAQAGTEGEAGGTNSFGETLVNQDTSDAFTPDETEFNIFNTDEKLAALQSLAELLRDVPGRKSVIHFSGGIEQTGVDNQAQLQATVDAANRSDVSFYTLDARGLAALPPGGDASSASPSGTAIYTSAAVSSQISSMNESRDTLATLASDTGGRMFYNLNDFTPAFRDILDANSVYYLLGYSPSDTRSDGRFRRIHVTVDRPGAKVEARPGYYAPKNFRQFTREDKDLQLQQAMDSKTPFLDLPLAVQTAYFEQPGSDYYVVLAAKVPGSAIPFQQKSKTHRTQFDFAWRATNPAGKVIAGLRDTLPVKLDASTYQQVLKGNILYEGGIVLPPGSYKLKVVVRENQSGKIGTFVEPLTLPAAGQTKLKLSSVVVSNQVERAGSKRARSSSKSGPNPLSMGAETVLPSVTRVFRTNQNLYVYLQSYGGKPASQKVKGKAGGAPASPSFALVFFRHGVQISEAGPYPGKIVNAGAGKAAYFTQIPLSKFPTGRYWMQVNVLDPAANEVAFSRVPLAIMPAPTAQKASGSGR